jgi:putative two-component system response regulator
MTKILVVDDEIETLNLLKTILEISGFEVITTLNSVDAITLAEIEKPDVVLPDIMMPEMDGFTLCKLMREHRITKDLPIIFVTAYSGTDLDDRSQAVGADHVIKKPINIPELVAAIRKTQALREQANVEVSKSQDKKKENDKSEPKAVAQKEIAKKETAQAEPVSDATPTKKAEKAVEVESKPAESTSPTTVSTNELSS